MILSQLSSYFASVIPAQDAFSQNRLILPIFFCTLTCLIPCNEIFLKSCFISAGSKKSAEFFREDFRLPNHTFDFPSRPLPFLNRKHCFSAVEAVNNAFFYLIKK